MLTLPIARRELLVLSRAGTTWRGRIGLSAMVLVFGVALAAAFHYGGQMVFRQVMHMLGVGLSLMCLFAGVSLTADAIAEEKRNGTLGLLLLTHLSPFEIVAGKLIAHAILGFYTVLCALPLLSMSMIFGGMPLGDVIMYLLTALNVLFFSASLGLFASCMCRDKRRAASLGMLILMLFWLVLPMLAFALPTLGGPRWLSNVFARLAINLAVPMGGGMGIQRFLPSTPVWWSHVWTQILAWSLIGLTVWCLPRRWHEEPPRKWRGLREFWKAISYGTSETRAKLRRKLMDRNPFMWLASRDRLQGLGVWLICVSLMAFFSVQFVRARLTSEMLIIMGCILCVVLQLALSTAASLQLYREYEQGTLEMILSTPLSVHDVIRGQLAAARRQCRTMVVIAFLLLWVGVALLFPKASRAEEYGAIAALMAFSGLAMLQFYAIGWVGMWAIVSAPDPKKAQTNAFFLVTVLPLMIFGLIVAAVQFLCWLLGITISPGPQVLVPCLFLLAFGNCIYWLRRARRELPERVRLFAFRRYSPPDRQSVFGKMGLLLGRGFAMLRLRAPVIPARE